MIGRKYRMEKKIGGTCGMQNKMVDEDKVIG
jgi:hypothetical protein